MAGTLSVVTVAALSFRQRRGSSTQRRYRPDGHPRTQIIGPFVEPRQQDTTRLRQTETLASPTGARRPDCSARSGPEYTHKKPRQPSAETAIHRSNSSWKPHQSLLPSSRRSGQPGEPNPDFNTLSLLQPLASLMSPPRHGQRCKIDRTADSQTAFSWKSDTESRFVVTYGPLIPFESSVGANWDECPEPLRARLLP